MIEAGLLGLGHALPAAAGAPDAPDAPDADAAAVSSTVSSMAERAMFTASAGACRLAEGEQIESLMCHAARAALDRAGLRLDQIDRLYGYALVSRHLSPNGLFAVHRGLELPRATWVVPMATDFTNFLSAVALAEEAVACGRARHVLVVCGAALSRHIEPGSGYAVSIGDAAAAAVVGPSTKDVIVEALFDTESALLEAATIDLDPRAGARFRLAPELLPALHDHGIERPVALVEQLLARHGVRREEITLIAHQPTRVLMGHWRDALRPAAILDTYDTIGNATLASVPATLALRRSEVTTPWMVLMSPGPGMHAMALLVRVT